MPYAGQVNGLPVEGVDVSSNNPIPRWIEAVPPSIAFVYVRYRVGTDYADPKFDEHVKAARDSGRLVGAYMFGKPDEDASDDAARMLDTKLHEMDLPPALDLESMNGRPALVVLNWTRTWLQTVEEQSEGVRPLLYTGPAFWRDLWIGARLTPGDDWSHWPLWLAQYGVPSPMMLKPWKQPTMHQYAGNTIAELLDGSHRQLFGEAAKKAIAIGKARLLAAPGIVPGIDGEVDRNRLLV